MENYTKTLVVIVLLSLGLSSCARSKWTLRENSSYNKPLSKTLIVLKGASETDAFKAELERVFNKRLLSREIHSSFLRIEGEGKVEGERSKVIKECKQVRCEDIVLIDLLRKVDVSEGQDSVEMEKSDDFYYQMRLRLVNHKEKKPSWWALMELDEGEVKGLEILLSVYAEKAWNELEKLWIQAKLIKALR